VLLALGRLLLDIESCCLVLESLLLAVGAVFVGDIA